MSKQDATRKIRTLESQYAALSFKASLSAKANIMAEIRKLEAVIKA